MHFVYYIEYVETHQGLWFISLVIRVSYAGRMNLAAKSDSLIMEHQERVDFIETRKLQIRIANDL